MCIGGRRKKRSKPVGGSLSLLPPLLPSLYDHLLRQYVARVHIPMVLFVMFALTQHRRANKTELQESKRTNQEDKPRGQTCTRGTGKQQQQQQQQRNRHEEQDTNTNDDALFVLSKGPPF